MFSINEINLLHSQNERLKQQNQDLQKENKELKNACKIERRRNANELEMSNRKLKQECEALHTELKFKVEYIQEQREVIKDLDKKLKRYSCYFTFSIHKIPFKKL